VHIGEAALEVARATVRTMAWWRGVVAAGAVVLGLAACSSGAPAPGPTADGWQRVALPTDAHLLALSRGSGAVMVSGERPVAGGLPDPVLLTSRDGRQWTPVALSPATLYGQHAGFLLMATDGDTAAMVGQRGGGAHGIPRFTTWTGTAGAQTEAAQVFELFGGPDSLGVVGLAGSGRDALAVGGWVGEHGAAAIAVWREQHGRWARNETVPVLQSDATHLKQAAGVAPAGAGYLVVGSVVDLSGDTAVGRAALWRSAGGDTWREQLLPGDSASAVDCNPAGDCLVVGSRGSRLASWHVTARAVQPVALPDTGADQTSRAWVCRNGGRGVIGYRSGDTGGVLLLDHGRWRRTSAPTGPVAGVACLDSSLLLLAGTPGAPTLWRLPR
jgi:hypothetical protein